MDRGFVPRKLFFTTGTGVHAAKLVSFEMALRAARIQQFNLVTVSSILPPGCEIVSSEEGLAALAPGEIVFCVLSQNASSDPGMPITASIGLALPANPRHHGYLSEHHECEGPEREAGAYAEQLAVAMLATALGLPDTYDPCGSRPQELEALREYVRGSQSIAQRAVGDPDGRWTTVVAVAVFVR
jgi:arginine decarboxylase